MTEQRRARRPTAPTFDRCEGRALTTVLVVLNGNSFRAATPGALTADAAATLRRESGDRVVQLATPAIRSPASIQTLATSIRRVAHGQPVGLVGFSAGGALALRLAALPNLRVAAVLDYYGVPDVRAYLDRHAADRVVQPIVGLSPFRPALVAAFSGPIATRAHVVAAFGTRDPNVGADATAPDLLADHPDAAVYAYDGGHGVGLTASRPALADFLAHL